ncbi:MAG: hypothetical protein ACRDG3_04765 [Tepidiformaceae bacterium]
MAFLDQKRLDDVVAFARRNRFVLALIGIGCIVVLVVSLRSGSTAATVWTGAIIGVLIGGVISFSQREKDAPNDKKPRR